jgi:hypothetical protein
MRSAIALFLILACVASTAGAEEQVVVPVGKTGLVKLAGHPVGSLICDDLHVVRPEVVVRGADSFLALTGLKPGATLCAINYLYFPRRVLRVVVAGGAPHRR